MDNLTHSLVGLVAGEALARKRPQLRGPLYMASLLANNFPDLDTLYTGLTGSSLGYILHHRGHTHTLLSAPFQSLLVLGILWLYARHRQCRWLRFEWMLLSVAAFIGPFLHIGLDALNVYGVHPYWPFNNRWYYGDAVFIIEPFLWLAFLPPLFLATTNRAGRWAYGTLFISAIALVLFHPLVPTPSAIAYIVAGCLLVLMMGMVEEPRRLGASVGIVLFFLVGMVATSQFIKQGAARELRQGLPQENFVDIVTSPAPANPFCWQVFAVSHTEMEYSVRYGSYRPFGGSEASCGIGSAFAPTAQLTRLHLPLSDKFVVAALFSSPLRELQTLYRASCEAQAFLRFARIPVWHRSKNGFYLGDLRFDRDTTLNFAERMLASAPANCPRFVPSWDPPRLDLLEL